MNELSSLIKFLLPLLPVALAALLPWLINRKKKNRHLQLIMPVIALIYGIVYLVYIDKICMYILGWIYKILDLMADLIAQVPALEFLTTINWAYGVLYVANIVMVILFIILKLIIMPFFSLQKPENSKIGKFLTGICYEYDLKDKAWYIKPGFAQSKRLMKVIYLSILAFSCILFSTTCFLMSKNLMSVPFYPIFGILIIGELYFYLCGLPKDGEKDPEMGDDPVEDPQEEVDYSLMKERYEELFGDRISGSAELPPTSDKRSAVEQLLQRYCNEADETGSQDAKLFHTYFSLLAQKENSDLDDGLISAARAILDGKNVLFNTPFYEDTTDYIFLPITRHLMRNKKLMIIVGRTGADKGIIDWLKKGLFRINNFESLWKVDYLSDCDESTKIAILPMKDIYNQKLLAKNSAFLEETTMVIITDPSRLLGTMQVGMSNVVSYLRRGTMPQYVAFDRNCDGLVDSLSHVLNSSIENVAATVVGTAKSTAMVWEADGHSLHSRLGLDTARYLGIGTELGAVGVSGKVSEVNWLSYEKFPATDIRWIVSQYYGPLCNTMEIPVSQAELEKRLNISADIWSMARRSDAFVIAEDEYNNPYEIIRQFSTRASKQAFIHVLSPNYLLRDYMCDNAEIFTKDPKAIPSLVADYQRVRNNTVYRITMRLINGEIYEEEIKAALELIGINSTDVYTDMIALITECFMPQGASANFADGIISVRNELVIDPKTRRPERKKVFSITNTVFIDRFLSQLQVVHYVAEDEQDKNLYMNSMLYGHIYQKHLPGNFVVFDGKYYEVVSITKHSGMVVRRAADHVTKRRYHRQLRSYNISGFHCRDEVASSITFGNVSIQRGEAAISVSTSGYLELDNYGDLKNATRVTLSGIPERNYPHKNLLRFKLEGANEKVRFTIATMLNELFVTLFPEMHEYIVATTLDSSDEKNLGYIPALSTDDEAGDYIYIIEDSLIDMGLLINVERYFKRILEIITDTLCWHSEQLKKEEAEGQTDGEDEPETGDGGSDEEEPEEESTRKKSWWERLKEWFRRIFRRKKKDTEEAPGEEATADGDGNTGDAEENGEATDAPATNDPAPEAPSKPKKPSFWDRFKKKKKKSADEPAENTDDPVSEPADADAPADGETAVQEPAAEPEKPKKPSFWDRFKRKKKAPSAEPAEVTEEAEEVPASEEAEPATEGGSSAPITMGNFKCFSFNGKVFSVIDENEEEITGEDEESEEVNVDDAQKTADPRKRKPYSQRFFLLYGYDSVPECLDLNATLDYLTSCGFEDNYLKRARTDAKNTKRKWYNNRFEPGVHYCDFCGTKLDGTISVLSDGRERCNDCKSTAITKVRDFKKLYKKTHARMEEIFGIKIKTKVSIRITNAQEIAKEGGYEFKPSPRFDGRALGFAQRFGNGRTRIMLENGSPRIETEKTLVHELTHVWQFENMGCLWEGGQDKVAIEGMAVWTEAQYLTCNGQEDRADAYVQHRSAEDSEYGQGMREYIRKYPLRKGKTVKNGTPFSHPGKNPLRR